MKAVEFVVITSGQNEGECNICANQDVCKFRVSMESTTLPLPCRFEFDCKYFSEEGAG